MIAIAELSLFWVTLGLLISVLAGGLASYRLISRQRKRTERRLQEVQERTERRLQVLEAELTLARQEQGERLQEMRSQITRLELRGTGTYDRFQKTTGVGLDKKHQVFSLARKGLGAEDISKQLNLYRGETELVLSLRRYCGHPEKKNARVVLQ
jgi:hypothetical protein